jgi:YggT family protein
VLYQFFTLIIDLIAGTLAGVFLLRFWTQAVHVRPPNSVGQFMYQLSDWLVKPLRRVMPGVGGYDWASLIGAFLVVLLSILITLLSLAALSPEALLALSVLRLLKWIIYGFTALLIMEVIFSWVNPHAPLAPFVRALNEPLMRPFRRIIPPIGGIDFTPMAVLLLFQVLLQFVLPVIGLQLVGPVLLGLVFGR